MPTLSSTKPGLLKACSADAGDSQIYGSRFFGVSRFWGCIRIRGYIRIPGAIAALRGLKSMLGFRRLTVKSYLGYGLTERTASFLFYPWGPYGKVIAHVDLQRIVGLVQGL